MKKEAEADDDVSIMKKTVITTIVVILIIAGMGLISNLLDQKAKEKSRAWQSQFFTVLQDMAQKPGWKKEYEEAINKLTIVVIHEVAKNPQAMRPFVEEITNLTDKAAPKSSIEITDQFLATLQNLAQNPAEENEYRKTINKLADVIKNEAKKNPRAMEPFLREMLELAAKANPGMALLFQDYADEAVKQEMTRLRQESNVIKSTEKEKQIEALKKEDEKNKKETGQLKMEMGRLEKIAQERDGLTSSVTTLQTKLGQLKTAESEKDKKIKGLEDKLGLTTKQVVPVFLRIDFPGWDFNLKIISETTEKFWAYHFDSSCTAVIMLSPGDYTIEGTLSGETVATIKKTVTREPSSFYKDKWYHCIIRTKNIPNRKEMLE